MFDWWKKEETVKPAIEVRLPEPNPEHERITRAAELLTKRKRLKDYISDAKDDDTYCVTVRNDEMFPHASVPVIRLTTNAYVKFLNICLKDIETELTDLGVPLS